MFTSQSSARFFCNSHHFCLALVDSQPFRSAFILQLAGQSLQLLLGVRNEDLVLSTSDVVDDPTSCSYALQLEIDEAHERICFFLLSGLLERST